MGLIAGDEHRPYEGAILRAYEVEATVSPRGRPVYAPHEVAPPSPCHAAVHKVRRLGRAAEVVPGARVPTQRGNPRDAITDDPSNRGPVKNR